MPSEFNIKDVTWSEPRIVNTTQGRQQMRQWKIPPHAEAFWQLWKSGYLKERGYRVSKWREEWYLTEWRSVDGERARAPTQARAVSPDDELPPALAARFREVERIYDNIEADTGEDFRYQLPSIKHLSLVLHHHIGAFDGTDTGVGKTAVACGVAKTLGRELFVVCPKSVITPWRRMARTFGVPLTVINYESLRTGNLEYADADEQRSYDAQGKLKRRRAFHWNEESVDPDSTLVMFDDCHKMKDPKTWNCLMGVQALQQHYRVLGASATAADNPMQMKFVALLTGLIWHPAHFWTWMKENGVRRGRFGLEFRGGQNVLRRIHSQIFPARGVRLRIADLGDRFPTTRIIAEAYDINEAEEGTGMSIAEIYEEMHREIAKLEASERKDKGANILTEQLRARQRVELLKVPTFVSMAEDALEEGMSVVIVLNFDASVQAVAQRLNKLRLTANTITGKDDPDYRQTVIDRFNDDEENLIVMNIKCGGVGITLKRTPQSTTTLVIISPSYSGIDLKQALGRCHRAGGAHSIQRIVFAAGTIEETACERVRRKIQRIDILNDSEVTTLLQGL